jgi:hypothetical protein
LKITQEILNELLDYCPETGKLTWRARDAKWFKGTSTGKSPEDTMRWWNKRFAGKPAFNYKKEGYMSGTLFYKIFKAHRIIWLMLFNESPEVVDHINGDGTDNRLVNLRGVTKKENSRNQKMPSHNTSGHIGVYWNIGCKKWVAAIRVDGVLNHLGVFSEKELAIQARKEAEKVANFHKNHGSV